MTGRAPALVLVNRAARHGSADERYRRLRRRLVTLLAFDEIELDPAGAWMTHVEAALQGGVATFIAAGGDGTVNALLAALVAGKGRRPLTEITLGAIGLGSSNDFHKPFGPRLDGVPVRIDQEGAAPRDIARARWTDAGGRRCERPFLVSASLGATAEANAFFGEGDGVLRALKRRFAGAAIAYAAVRTLARHRNLPARLRVAGHVEAVDLSSLSVSKTAHLAGAFRYDTPVDPADGRLAVNLCEGMDRPRLLATLAALARGRFAGRPGTRHWSVETIAVDVDQSAALELDGEVFHARAVLFDVLPERLRVCA